MNSISIWLSVIALSIAAAATPALAAAPSGTTHVLGLGVDTVGQWTGSAPACERVPPPSHC